MSGVKDIFLDQTKNTDFKDYMLFGDDKPVEILPNFNTINIFVGSNNSGKSRFMRTLMKQQKIKGINSYNNLLKKIAESNNLVKHLDIQWQKNPNIYSASTNEILGQIGGVVISQLNFNASQYFLENPKAQFEQNLNQFEMAEKLVLNSLTDYYINSSSRTNIEITDEFKKSLKETIELTKEILSDYKIEDLGNNLNYFIPTLRTAHSLFEEKQNQNFSYSKLKKDIFFDTLLKNYELKDFANKEPFVKKEDEASEIKKTYIFTGISLYNQIVNARNGSKIERRMFDEFEKFIGKQFFNTDSIDIVAQFNITEKHQDKDDNEIINISIEEDEGKNLHDLGDGIQSLIILMYSIFMAPKNTAIYIDEPELNLHPGMQRLFLEQITSNKALTEKNLTYIITTHSNHFLDLTIEKDNVSVYSFSKNKGNKFLIKNVNVGDNELLRELGVNNSSVFLANSSIWVEGISDRNYIKAFLIAYCNKNPDKISPKEDIDFAFLEYAGSNLTHYDFSRNENENIQAFALNNRILILADEDSGKEEKHKKHKELCKLNPQNLEYLSTKPYREIENLLSNEVWENVLIHLCNKKKVKIEEAKIQASIKTKIEKVKIIDFKEKYIGEYLEALEIQELNSVYDYLEETPKSLKSEYKTSLSKIILDKAINKELKWEDFSKNPKVAQLTASIYCFITKK